MDARKIKPSASVRRRVASKNLSFMSSLARVCLNSHRSLLPSAALQRSRRERRALGKAIRVGISMVVTPVSLAKVDARGQYAVCALSCKPEWPETTNGAATSLLLTKT
jgi:hypothetical protein